MNVNQPQLLSIVVSAAQNGEFEPFGGFSLTVATRYQETSLKLELFVNKLRTSLPLLFPCWISALRSFKTSYRQMSIMFH